MRDNYKLSAILRLTSAVLLLIALGNHPSSYYAILRWVVSGSSIYSGWVLSRLKKHNWGWFFFIAGILFNPVIPFYLDRSTWQLIDIVAAIIFFISLSVKNINDEKCP